MVYCFFFNCNIEVMVKFAQRFFFFDLNIVIISDNVIFLKCKCYC